MRLLEMMRYAQQAFWELYSPKKAQGVRVKQSLLDFLITLWKPISQNWYVQGRELPFAINWKIQNQQKNWSKGVSPNS